MQERQKSRTELQADAAASSDEADLSEKQAEEVEEHTLLPVPFVYQIVRREGERELARPASSLWWSGVSAGIMIGFSTLVEAILHLHLPDAGWRPLVENLGYSVGFLLVILSRYQLFTENTITVILPFAVERTMKRFLSVARLWAIVAVANITGALVFAAFWTFTPVAPPDVLDAMRDIGRQTMELGWGTMFSGSIVAGLLIAALVWIMPTAETAKFWAIIIVTYVIALADLPHIVAGGVEVLLLLAGEVSLPDFLLRFGLPVFLGNVLGGTGLFSLISYAQVQQEIRGTRKLG